MGFDVGRVWPAVLGLPAAFLASWLGVAVLLMFSVAGNQAAAFLLLVWALVVAGWCAVYAGRLRRRIGWPVLALMAPALPLVGGSSGCGGGGHGNTASSSVSPAASRPRAAAAGRPTSRSR